LDEAAMFDLAKRHGKVLVVTEEPVHNTFAQSLAARMSEHCFEYLDAPVRTLGAANMPAVPLNTILEQEMIPSISKVEAGMRGLLGY
jgi:2-oxoisovalerate dehydrogenase E1 component